MLKKRILPLSCALLLSACSSLQKVPAGTDFTQVTQQFGAPSRVCEQADGSRIANWSTQPMGRYAWATVVDSHSAVGPIQQVLSDDGFASLGRKAWNIREVECWFGPPHRSEYARLKGVRYVTWTYRYLQGGVFKAHMYVYFDEDGAVVHYHPGPDPSEINDGWAFDF